MTRDERHEREDEIYNALRRIYPDKLGCQSKNNECTIYFNKLQERKQELIGIYKDSSLTELKEIVELSKLDTLYLEELLDDKEQSQACLDGKSLAQIYKESCERNEQRQLENKKAEEDWFNDYRSRARRWIIISIKNGEESFLLNGDQTYLTEEEIDDFIKELNNDPVFEGFELYRNLAQPNDYGYESHILHWRVKEGKEERK